MLIDYSNNARLRYFRIAGITIQVASVIPIHRNTFSAKFKPFEVDGPGDDTISIEHRFSVPDLHGHHMGQDVYRRGPWAIYRKNRVWMYVNYSSDMLWDFRGICSRVRHGLKSSGRKPRRREQRKEGLRLEREGRVCVHQLAICSYDHGRIKIFNNGENLFRGGNLPSLTLFPTDQVLLARVLAQRQGCFFHAGGVALDGRGFLFVGHSGAGKTTIVAMMKPLAEVLCDDRMIVRRWPEGMRAHGNWSHGDIEDVSPNAVALKAIFFLNKARENRIVRLADRNEIVRKLLACLVRPFVTSDWWDQILDLVEDIAFNVPCYSLYFDTSGDIVPLLQEV
jgi:hypothetical protein